ncbi:pectin lyase fold/virulence factor [Hypoxylon crocopeplum]|nr:pectin lyase fold/virulence factor [Hypoxylon crocopeplum]
MFCLSILLLLCFCTWSSASEGSVTYPVFHSTLVSCRRRPHTSSTSLVPVPISVHSLSSSSSIQLETLATASSEQYPITSESTTFGTPQSATTISSYFAPALDASYGGASLSTTRSSDTPDSTTLIYSISYPTGESSSGVVSTQIASSTSDSLSGLPSSSSESYPVLVAESGILSLTSSSSGSADSYSSVSSTVSISSSQTPSLTPPSIALAQTANNSPAITVSPDGSTGYSSIGAAITYAQANGYSVVNVLAGTYTENVLISGTAAVTVVGETTSGSTDYTGNLVNLSNGGGALAPLTFNTNSGKGVAWKNINFLNTNSSSTAGLVYLRGSKNAFYSCAFTAAGSVAFTGSYASGIIANSYLEATDKVISSYASLYVYGSTITATTTNANLVYNKGAISGTTLYNSTVVLDTCSVIQKAGKSNTNVFLAAANGVGSVVVYRDTSLASFIAGSGVHVDLTTQDARNAYIEFRTSGAGSYSSKVSSRAAYVSWITDVTALSAYDISTFFITAYPTVAVTTVDWIDSAVLSAIQASNAADSSSSSSTSSAITTSTSSTIASTVSSSAAIVSTSTTSQSLVSLTSLSSSASASATCLPSSMPSTALIVGPEGSSCGKYTSISAAIAALPADSTTQYIYVLAGTYTEQATLVRNGATIIRGETTNSLACSSNLVTIKYTAAVSASAGGSSSTAAFLANKYEAKLVSFYNINFENSYAATTNYVSLGVYAKGKQVAFYGCSIKATQGALYLDYGNFFFSGGRIEGTTDFIWGQGAGYIYNSVIVSSGTTAGQSIAAHKYQSSYGQSQFVFDTCAIVPKDNSVPTGSTFLGRDYSTNSTIAFVNSYLDAHISSTGWKVASSSSFTGSFVEANNTGPGAVTAGRISSAKILTDSSPYTVANALGDVSWLDSSAIAPFLGWPNSVYAATAISTSSTSVSMTASATASASATGSTFTVAPSPTSGQFGSVSSAIAALPSDGLEYTIYILAGTYEEQLSITRRGKVTLRGETSFANDFSQNTVLIKFSDGVSTSANQNEETPVINWKNTNGDGLALYNINFTNTYPQTSSTAALAADFYGKNMAAYGCAFKGFQDSLLVNQGVQVFSNSYIEGSVDFIWGYSKAYFHQCYIASNTPSACITAQNRPSSTWAGGFVFDHSIITYTASYGTTYGSTYLGRPWSQYAVVVYMNSYLDQHIASAGWSIWQTSDTRTTNVLLGEYNNTGPGNWTSSRASFASQLTESQAAAYSLGTFIGSTDWLDMTAYNLVPSYSLTSTTGATTTTGWTHPTDGTTPPQGAVLVSVDGTVSGSYKTLTAALASLPSDSATQIIFMYPGEYNEQPPAINRAGQVVIMGYTDDAPGRTFKTNQVTITQARGLSVSPLPTGHSNAETATIQTASKKISMYNINIVNSENLDGSQSSYVTLAASIYGDKIGFYGCTFIGWQDTLLTGATAGYQYYESCYIEGAIDFIWGYSKAYFKGCTIGAKRSKSAITAHSRSSLSAIGGYIFDQCLFTAADTATVDLTGLIYLGRPYSQYALVAIKNSYLDNVIQPAGWKIWSTTDPRTDHVIFAEYNNVGPGNWENNAAARQAFENCTLLTKDDYPLTSVMDSTDWIDMTYWDSIVTPTPAETPTTGGTTTYDGTQPPAGAYIVSKNTIEGTTTYDTIQSALDALPTSSKITATVFIYPGTYEEKLVLSKSGTTVFLGYSTSPGDYSQNQVTITYNEGIDTQADASNSDSATVYATGNYFQAVNINFANTFGTTEDYASLGFGVRSSKYASLYGCKIYGNQDALLINGYLFASNSYVEGNIDMIWGSGAGYFLNSTIAPNKDGISLTADKRATNTTAGGFVFDQCTIEPAGGASYSSISLGRPWNQYARVAFVQSYLASCIEATGWDYWTKSDPRTSDVLFGELANYGPGASTTGRASFATQLDASSAAQFELSNFFAATSWINASYVSATPFTVSNISIPISSTISSSTVFTTVYTTIVPTTKQTLYTTVTATDRTVSTKTTLILDVGTTISEPPVTKTTTIKSTTTNVLSITEADETVTKKSTMTVNVGTTITPESATRTVSSTITFTITDVATSTPKVSTIKSTTTETSYVTSTPKLSTVTTVVGSTVTSTRTSTPRAVTVTSTKVSTAGSNDITTVTKKATTTTVSAFTTSTKTVKSTMTISCTPAGAVKRDAVSVIPDSVIPESVMPTIALAASSAKLPLRMGVRDVAVQTRTVTATTTSVYTSVVKTSTFTVPGSTITTEIVTTKTTGKTSTLKASTTFETTYSVATKTTSVIQLGSTVTTTSATTITTGKTSTLKPATVTTTSVGSTTTTVKSTSTLAAQTITSDITTRRVVTSILGANTVTITSTSNAARTQTLTLPASTVTKTTTSKTTLTPAATITQQATVTKTTTVKVTHTTTSVITRTSKNAGACTTA